MEFVCSFINQNQFSSSSKNHLNVCYEILEKLLSRYRALNYMRWCLKLLSILMRFCWGRGFIRFPKNWFGADWKILSMNHSYLIYMINSFRFFSKIHFSSSWILHKASSWKYATRWTRKFQWKRYQRFLRNECISQSEVYMTICNLGPIYFFILKSWAKLPLKSYSRL